jgi:hypothetical protein
MSRKQATQLLEVQPSRVTACIQHSGSAYSSKRCSGSKPRYIASSVHICGWCKPWLRGSNNHVSHNSERCLSLCLSHHVAACVFPAGYNLSLVHLTIKDTRYGPGADVVSAAASSRGGSSSK